MEILIFATIIICTFIITFGALLIAEDCNVTRIKELKLKIRLAKLEKEEKGE